MDSYELAGGENVVVVVVVVVPGTASVVAGDAEPIAGEAVAVVFGELASPSFFFSSLSFLTSSSKLGFPMIAFLRIAFESS